MGACLEVITGRVTNPGAALTTVTPGSGDSFTIRSFPDASKAHLVNLWAEDATGGVLQVFSQRMHDAVHGLRLQIPAGDDLNLLGLGQMQQLYPNDPLTVQLSGGGAEVDVVSLLNYYDNLPGVDQQLATWAQIVDRIVNLMGLEVDLTSGGTAGDYGGSRALNADFPNLKANKTYALLGYTMASKTATVGIKGADTGNTRIGMPGGVETFRTAQWFVDMSDRLGKPCIPLIQANNAASTNVDLVDTATATARHVSFHLAELA